jgi:NADH dehydrogenase [ubiquinone] 1 alpha subcomplex assembly factor 7
MPETPLLAELIRRIALDGPMTVANYMALCLGHPQHGYYMSRDPLGTAGDFTTAPEISQMFGELLGLWAAEVWQLMGRPQPLHLIELGPGRGTLMADALRVTRNIEGFAPHVHLVETSPVLRDAQRVKLANVAPQWHETLETVPMGASIILGNEFLDALPIRQFIRSDQGWHERLIGLSESGKLMFGLSGSVAEVRIEAPAGSVLEISPAQEFLIADQIAPRLLAAPGAALFIDYGSTAQGYADTLQAVLRHQKIAPLQAPGESDLTAHVPFPALAETARRAGLAVHGPVRQREFLAALGLPFRAQALHDRANDASARADIGAAFDRLTDDCPTGMGALFKVLGLSSPGLGDLPGLLIEPPRLDPT